VTGRSWLRVRKLHRWDLSPKEAVRLQRSLTGRVVPVWDGRSVRAVGGADVSFPSRREAAAAFCVLSFPGFEILEYAVKKSPVAFPYVPGLLSFREIPALLAAMREVETAPDVIICDAQGLAHPRGMGLAAHLGILIDTPTIGCAKSRLFGEHDEPGQRKGQHVPLRGPDGSVIGRVVRTRTAVRPVYVSIGNRVDLDTSVRIVLDCCTSFRLPEPARAAHRLAGGWEPAPRKPPGRDHDAA
jgi:deoxyribonuclease V